MRVNISSPLFVQAVARSRITQSSMASRTALSEAGGKTAGLRSSVSTLAQKLSAAATRADIRDKTLPAQELRLRASRILDELSGAQRSGKPLEKISYSGMSRHEYALITYDETGVFTLDERVAACKESARQENLWRQLITQLAAQELSTTGQTTESLKRALSHYKSLPAIEQAQYPEGYAAGLEPDALQTKSQSGAVPPGIKDALPELAYAAIDRSTGLVPVRQSSEFGGIGRELMLSRLFDGSEPPVFDGSKRTLDNLSQGRYRFLTRQDRDLLSDVYAYAQEQGMDLAHVDCVAWDLGGYRQRDDGRAIVSFNKGGVFDTEGRKLAVSFAENDAATASRLLKATALATTQFDQGFIRYILDPGFSAFGHAGHFEFLEHVVTRFSAEAERVAPLGNRFSRCLPLTEKERGVITASVDVKKPKIRSGLSDSGDIPSLDEKARLPRRGHDGPSLRKPHSLFELLRFADAGGPLRENDEMDRRAISPSWIGSFWRIIKQR